MSDINYKKTSKLVTVIVIMVIAGSLLGAAWARENNKNSLGVSFQKTVRLADDIYIEHPEYQVDIRSADEEEDEPLLIPAGTEGTVREHYWYYNVYRSGENYNEFTLTKSDYITVQFSADKGAVKVRFTDQQTDSFMTSGIPVFKAYKLESYDSTLAEINRAINEFHSQWISREIIGGVTGLVISLIVAVIVVLIRKRSSEVTIDSTLTGIVVVIDIILIVADVIFIYAFTRLI